MELNGVLQTTHPTSLKRADLHCSQTVFTFFLLFFLLGCSFGLFLFSWVSLLADLAPSTGWRLCEGRPTNTTAGPHLAGRTQLGTGREPYRILKRLVRLRLRRHSD